MNDNPCNCWIGILNAYEQSELNDLYIESYKTILEERSERTSRMAKLFLTSKIVLPKDYINKRKSLATLFSYCPNCGNTINWKKLQKELSDE